MNAKHSVNAPGQPSEEDQIKAELVELEKRGIHLEVIGVDPDEILVSVDGKPRLVIRMAGNEQ